VKIDIWSDVACPWCYIGKRRFETALRGFEHKDQVEVAWHSFQLDPTLPDHYDGTEAQYLAASKKMPEQQVREMFAGVVEQATAEGLHYDFDALRVANSLRAHQLLHIAKRHEVMDVVEEALFSAHFEQGVDIGDEDALVTIGARSGIPEAEIREALASRALEPEVAQDVAQAQALGIRAVPTFVFDMTYAVAGAQSPEVFSTAFDQAWQASHPVLQRVPGADGDGSACGPDGCTI
jgi:predicted DsbA family dithiol-disulfide isomerase